jgi:hypothetical protein
MMGNGRNTVGGTKKVMIMPKPDAEANYGIIATNRGEEIGKTT